MARKKSKSVTTAPKESKTSVQKESTMVSKVEVKTPQNTEKVSRTVGLIFIVLGVCLVAFGIYSFVKYSSTPKLDDSLLSPSITEIPTDTNSNEITIKGSAEGYDKVFVYVNGNQLETANVDAGGKFTANITLDSEGKYEITVAGVKGFPQRHLSTQSTVQIVNLDKQAPVLSDIKYPSEVGTATFTVTGKVEKDAQVIIKRGTDYYSATCDDQGNFKIASIALDKGANVFNMLLKDTAGNETVLEGGIKITYSQDSGVNGDAVTDNSLPVAAGEMSRMKDFFLGNNLVMVFGLLALLSGITTTSVLYVKNRKE